jgi:hypothetical protein
MKLQSLMLKFVLCLSFAVSGCTTTSHFAEEYRRTYKLTEPIEVRPCRTFTDGLSVWFGPEDVECAGGSWSGKPTIVFPKGSFVKVEKLFRIGAIDAFYDQCRVRIVDDKGNVRVVYSDWPSLSKLLVSTN